MINDEYPLSIYAKNSSFIIHNSSLIKRICSSVVEQSAVNRQVVGSNPTESAYIYKQLKINLL
jgi:hypothetical protein